MSVRIARTGRLPLSVRNRYDSEALVDFLINLFYAIAANLYLGSSDGSSGGGQQ